MSDSEPQLHRVSFPLEQDQEGYPPYTEEGLWVRQVSEGVGVVVSIPFFVVGVSRDDIISFDDSFRFRELLSARGHSTIRLIVDNEETLRSVQRKLLGFGCAVETGPVPSLLSVDIPTNLDYATIRDYVASGSETGLWDYEESCISAEHRATF